MKKIANLLVVLLGVSNLSLAEGPGWQPTTKIKRIVVVSSGGVNVRFENELNNCTSLSGYGAKYASLYPEHPGADRIYSMLVAAYVSQKEVQVYLSDDTCKIGEVVLGGSYNS